MGYFNPNILHQPPTRDNPGTMVFYQKPRYYQPWNAYRNAAHHNNIGTRGKPKTHSRLWGLGIPRSALISLIVRAFYEDDSLTFHARIPIPKNATNSPCQVCPPVIFYVFSHHARFVRILSAFALSEAQTAARRIHRLGMASIAPGMLWYPFDGCCSDYWSQSAERISLFRSATRLLLFVIIGALLVDLLINFNILWNSQSIREMALL